MITSGAKEEEESIIDTGKSLAGAPPTISRISIPLARAVRLHIYFISAISSTLVG